jgi:hypothetical protein
LTEIGQKAARQMKSTTYKKERIAYLLQVTMQMGEIKVMTMMMGENLLSQTQVHVTAFQGTEG